MTQAIISIYDPLRSDRANARAHRDTKMLLFELQIPYTLVTVIESAHMVRAFHMFESTPFEADFFLSLARLNGQSHYYLIDQEIAYIVYAKDGRRVRLGRLKLDITARSATRFQIGSQLLGVFR